MDRHWDENTKVLVWQVQLPLETATLCNYGKTLMGIMLIFGVGCTGTKRMWLIPSVNVDASGDQGLICKFCISGWWSIASTVVAFILFTDCLIYWIHRFLHHKYVYKYIHKGHHTWKVSRISSF